MNLEAGGQVAGKWNRVSLLGLNRDFLGGPALELELGGRCR